MARPQPADFPPYFERYISQVKTNDLTEAIHTYSDAMLSFYTSLPEDKADYRYASDKWTLKDVLQHIIDAERIFSYRILRFSRKDSTPLPSFDENTYAVNASASGRSFASIKEEFVAVRKSTDLLIKSLSEEQLASSGIASNLNTTANAVGFIVFGHMIHHKNIIEERYL